MEKYVRNEILKEIFLPRPSQVANDEEMRKDSEVMRILVRKNNKMICLYLGNDEDVFELAIQNGFEITEEFLTKYPNLCTSKSIMTQAINKYKNGNLIIYYTGSEEKVFELAIKNGFDITEELLIKYPTLCTSFTIMKEAIKKNPDLVKLYNSEEAIDKKNHLEYDELIDDENIISWEKKKLAIKNAQILDKCKLYLYAIKNGYKANSDEMQELISRITIKHFPNLISLYKGDDIDLIDYAIECGYIPKEKDIANKKGFRKSSNVFKKLIPSNYNLIYYYMGFDDSIYKLALESGFIIDINKINKYMLYSYSMMNELIRDNPNMMSNYLGKKNVTELMTYAIEHGYKPTIDDLEKYRNNDVIEILLPYFIKDNPDLIMFYKGDNESLFEQAVQSGFILTEKKWYEIIHFYNNYTNNFMHSKCIIKQMLETNRYLLFAGDLITFEYAAQYGFVPTRKEIESLYKEKHLLLSSSLPMLNAIKNDYSLIIYYLGRDELVFQTALDNGYQPTIDDLKKYDNLLNSTSITKYALTHMEPYINNIKFQELFVLNNANIVMNFNILQKINDFLMKKEVSDYYSNEDIMKICKYIIALDEGYEEYNNNDAKTIQKAFYKIIDNGHLSILDNFIKYINDTSTCSKKYCISLIKIVDKFYDNFDLINDVINNQNLTSREKDIILESIESDDLSFNSIKDVREYNKQKLRDYKNNKGFFVIENYYEVIDDILGTLDISKYGISSIKDLEKLRDNIQDKDMKDELTVYLLYFEFIEKIKKIEDSKTLETITYRIIDYALNNSSINVFYDVMHKFNDRIKAFFAQEIKEKLIDFNSLSDKENERYKVEKNKYLASDIILHGEDISGKKVDYIELDGLDYIALVHVLNAYGQGGMLYDFKNPRIIGKSYICLSAIKNDTINIAPKKQDEDENEKEEDNVTLLFNKFDTDQFVMESNVDIYSYASIGSLDVISNNKEHYLPIDDLIKANVKNYHNELVFYREKDSGGFIYPTGILASNNPPLQSEINAAAYLNVPIVYVNKEKYLNKGKSNEIETKYERKELIGMYQELLDQLNEIKAELLASKPKRV